MRLKHILSEAAGDKQAAREINAMLSSGDYLLTPEPIYRGMSTKVETYIKRKPRTGRKPKATPKIGDKFINLILDTLYPNEPVRSRSTFASIQRGFAVGYGSTTNILIPKKNAKVRFYDQDTWPAYTQFIYERIKSGVSEIDSTPWDDFEKITEEFDNLAEITDKNVADFLRGMWLLGSNRNAEYLEKVSPKFNSLKPIIKGIQEILKLNPKNQEFKLSGRIYSAAKHFHLGIKRLHKYVENGSESYIEDVVEVIVEGDHLIIKPEWFFEYFNWNVGNPILKKEF